MDRYTTLNDLLASEAEPEDVLKRIYNTNTWFSYVDELLAYREFVKPANNDDDLETLIAWYENKRSKRVSYAGLRLRKAFLSLPPVDQRKVGMALLTGCRSDVEWVCQRLDNYKRKWNEEWIVNWHPCYSDLLESAWNKYRSKHCGRVLIQFLDKEVVKRHMCELLENYELYFRLCRRFAGEEWFTVDKERLASCTTINAYLSVMHKTAEGISDSEAKSLLYQWIATIATECLKPDSDFKNKNVFWEWLSKRHRVINAQGIDTALYYILKMKKYNVVSEFLDWDREINRIYVNKIHHRTDSKDLQDIFCKTITDNLPIECRKYSQQNDKFYLYMSSSGQPLTTPKILDPYRGEELYLPAYKDAELINKEIMDMMEKVPNIDKLIDKLGLTPVYFSDDKDSQNSDLPF